MSGMSAVAGQLAHSLRDGGMANGIAGEYLRQTKLGY